MTSPFKSLLLLLPLVLSTSGCLDADPKAQQRAEEERRYVESRIETLEKNLSEAIANLPAERILEVVGPELMARQARIAHDEARRALLNELRTELSVELDLRCEELCQNGVLDARRSDRAEAEAGRDEALEELKKLRKEMDEESKALDKAWTAVEEEREILSVKASAATPTSCSVAGDAAFQQGLYGDALSKYRDALKNNKTPECHRVLASIYGALGYKKNQAKHLTDYLHLMRPQLRAQQVAIIQAELRAARR